MKSVRILIPNIINKNTIVTGIKKLFIVIRIMIRVASTNLSYFSLLYQVNVYRLENVAGVPYKSNPIVTPGYAHDKGIPLVLRRDCSKTLKNFYYYFIYSFI